MPKKISSLFLHPRLIFFSLAQKGLLNFLSDRFFLKVMYWARFHKRLNFEKPVSYNEAIQYLKIYDRNPHYGDIVDKYTVRTIIEDTIGGKYLVPLLGVFNTPEEIDLDSLPNQFVIKCTHGTHCSIICSDKKLLDFNDAKKKLEEWLGHNYYYNAREWPYKNIRPRIMIEELIKTTKQEPPLDIKFMCFDGNPEFIVVHRNITEANGVHTINLFSPNWEPIDVEWDCPRFNGIIAVPECLEEMTKLAKALAKDFVHVRVDFLVCEKRVYFGELTLYPGAGFKPFSPESFDRKIGSLMKLEKAYDKHEC